MGCYFQPIHHVADFLDAVMAKALAVEVDFTQTKGFSGVIQQRQAFERKLRRKAGYVIVVSAVWSNLGYIN